jgi:hypothetical protein
VRGFGKGRGIWAREKPDHASNELAAAEKRRLTILEKGHDRKDTAVVVLLLIKVQLREDAADVLLNRALRDP